MLVLSRKVEESILIGDSIRIKVVGLGYGRAIIGIEAPQSFAIVREELLQRGPREPLPPEDGYRVGSVLGEQTICEGAN